MPVRWPADVCFTVKDQSSCTLRSELVPAGTDLPDRLRTAHQNYRMQGWACDPLKPGHWNFFAVKDGKRVLIGFVKANPAAPAQQRWPVPNR